MKDLLARLAPYNKAWAAIVTPLASEFVQAVVDASADWLTGVVTVLAVYLVPNAKPVAMHPVE